MLPSLSTQSSIKVDTSDFNELNSITNVTLSLSSGNYGAGQHIDIFIHFKYEIFINSTKATGLPYIQLLLTTYGGNGRAVLTSDSKTFRTLILKFSYTIQSGDSTNSLDYIDENSLYLLGNILYDGINRQYNIMKLPLVSLNGISISKTIIIDTSIPIITHLITNTINGEYGAGERIEFIIIYNLPVNVSGIPKLALTSTEYAYYISKDITSTNLTFIYDVGINAPITTTLGFSNTIIELPIGSSIKRLSPIPITDADIDITQFALEFIQRYSIDIDTTPPILDTTYGVTTDKSSGIYYAGEIFLIYIKFNKPISIKGISITLYMDTGRGFSDTALINRILPDLQTLEFKYITTTNVNITGFDIYTTNALYFVGDSNNYIRRLSTNPLTNVNTDTSLLYNSGNTLRTNKQIIILSAIPVIRQVLINTVNQQDTSGNNLYADDTVIIDVIFSTPIYTICNPVIIMDTHETLDNTREAKYIGGNESNILQFKYTVQISDRNSIIAYRFTPNSFCLSSGCPVFSSCSLLALSTIPTLEAEYVMPIPSGTIARGEPISGGLKSYVINPSPYNRDTTVTSVIATTSYTEIGSGTFVQFLATFTDEVQFDSGRSNITLFLSTNKYAVFGGGTGSKILVFTYITDSTDTISLLKPQIIPGTSSAFNCKLSELCKIINLQNQIVNLTTTYDINLFSSHLSVNVAKPKIIDVYTMKETSPYDGVYSVGETFEIIVRFDKPVFISAKAPQLRMNLGRSIFSASRYAEYQPTLSNQTHLLFFLQITEGDYSNDLTYDGLDAFFIWSPLYRVATLQDTEVNYTMPYPIKPIARNGNILKIDTLTIPKIISLTTFNTPDKTYYPGDRIYLKMTYSQYVIMNGLSYLLMRLGDHVQQAKYIGTENTFNTTYYKIPTKTFYFLYIVSANDFNNKLDYVDSFSFLMGFNEVGDITTVLRSSSIPIQRASLDLPRPGKIGSLSGIGGASLYINGFIPYVNSFGFVNKESLTIGVNYKIDLEMNFTIPVIVTGKPYVLLETGIYDREAYYYSGSGTNRIIFRYIVQPGDTTAALDYYADRATSGSASKTFQLNGGSILAASFLPTVAAFIRLNPVGGVLTGTYNKISTAGQFQYLDLTIPTRGPDYFIRFSTSPSAAYRTITSIQDMFISFSNEFKLTPKESLKGHFVGGSVDIDGDISVVGAPNSNKSITSIQLVTTTVKEFIDPISEVQIFGATLLPQPAIIEFHTTADIDEILDGTFIINFGTLGSTLEIPINANPTILKSIIERDAFSVGLVEITRTSYTFCACENAYSWTITFIDYTEGPMFDITFDINGMYTNNLNYNNLNIEGPLIIQSPANLLGTFTLESELTGKISNDIPYNANIQDIIKAITEIDLIPLQVLISPSTPSGLRVWEVTFGAYHYSNEIPKLIMNKNNLFGGIIDTFVEISVLGKHGPRGINGFFTLSFKGNTTIKMPYNVSDIDMKIALEALDTINMVNVIRSIPTTLQTFTWTIEFVETRTNSPRGYNTDLTYNVEPLIAKNYLIGTDTDIIIKSLYKFEDENHLYDYTRRGTYGSNAGRVYIYQKVGEQAWDEVALVTGDDTDENDRFGHDVAINGDYLLVGAPNADKVGVSASQSLYCNATSGYFIIEFRGWKSANIPFDVERNQLISYIEASKHSLKDSLVPLQGIIINDWLNPNDPYDQLHPGLCYNHTAIITFMEPTYGAPVLNNGVDVGANMELLTIDKTNLQFPILGDIIIKHEIYGTRNPDGPNADVMQQGSAYLFEAKYNCLITDPNCIKNNWKQKAQFFPLDPITGLERFGYSVAITDTDVAIGSPGSINEEGRVYIYHRELDGTYSLLQVLKYLFGKPGDNFGHSVALEGNTLIIGSPYANNNTGSVYSFKRVTVGSTFIYDQILLPPIGELQINDLYGWSVALEDNTAVVGAIQHDSSDTIYLGNEIPPLDSPKQLNTGAVYLFQRRDANIGFIFLEKLIPTNVKEADQFGYSVDINSKTIIVGAIENHDDNILLPSVPIMQIESYATYNKVHLGSSFKLTWLTKNETFIKRRKTSSILDIPIETTELYETPPLKNDGAYGFILRTTRVISHDVTAAELEQIIEEDLYTGDVIVTRAPVDIYNGGYIWYITFVNYLGDGENLPLMEADISLLTGTNAKITINFMSPSPPKLRGLTHIFQQESLNEIGNFKEQVFITPFSYQSSDRCGYSVAIYQDYALVGCPNRDGAVPNTNAGAGIIFYLSLLSLKFSSKQITTEENNGNKEILMLRRHEFPTDVFYFLKSIDRNSPPDDQRFLQQLYGIGNIASKFPKTIADVISIYGTAISKSQYYGSTHNESLWLNGIYDYRGINDYVPLLTPWAFLTEYNNATDQIVINPDTIKEIPNENISLVIYSPGIFPSPQGRLFSVLTILDNAIDGEVSITSSTSPKQVYSKLYKTNGNSGDGIGNVLMIDTILNVMVVGCPLTTINNKQEAGEVLIFRRNSLLENWEQIQILHSTLTISSFNHFGDAVVINHLYDRNIGFIIIGEPKINSVHIYISKNISGNAVGELWTYEKLLTTENTTLAQHRFGEKGTIGLDGYTLVIGAPGLETIYIYLYIYNSLLNKFDWTFIKSMVSSDYDYDIIVGIKHIHRQEFGKSVAVSGRTIAVGAPYADYDKLGSEFVEIDYATEGTSIYSTGRGKVYIFDSYEAIQTITIYAAEQLSFGTFILSYESQGILEYTTNITFSSSESEIQTILTKLNNIDSISVQKSSINLGIGGYIYSWTITFNAEMQNPSLLKALWKNGPNGHICETCISFSHTSTIDIEFIRGVEDIKEYQKIVANDRRQGDRFGYTIAIDNQQIVVGAIYSAAITTTTWDFEGGTLEGWSITGTAFTYQPTFGDNSNFRSGYLLKRTPMTNTIGISTNRETSNLVGNYYVGTYELRPGTSTDYTIPNINYPQGNTQGDIPQGTMLSQVFTIRGTMISFLLGGGCDMFLIYVSLLIDGLEVARVTGKCTESMERNYFDVSSFISRSAQIKIVDASSSNWGHINIDDFKFNWEVSGSQINGTSTTTNRVMFGGMVETPQAGAAYVFRRHVIGNLNHCNLIDKNKCIWEQETKLMASDKRAYDHFGSSVTINDKAGVIVIGSPHAIITDFFKQIPTVYPYQTITSVDISGITFPLKNNRYDLQSNLPYVAQIGKNIKFPIAMFRNDFFSNLPSYAFQVSAVKAMSLLDIIEDLDHSEIDNMKAGAIYVYRREPAVVALDTVTTAPHWSFTEYTKIQPPDINPFDYFGTAVSLSDRTLMVSSIGQDGYQPNSGAIYLYDTIFAALYFEKVFIILLYL